MGKSDFEEVHARVILVLMDIVRGYHALTRAVESGDTQRILSETQIHLGIMGRSVAFLMEYTDTGFHMLFDAQDTLAEALKQTPKIFEDIDRRLAILEHATGVSGARVVAVNVSDLVTEREPGSGADGPVSHRLPAGVSRVLEKIQQQEEPPEVPGEEDPHKGPCGGVVKEREAFSIPFRIPRDGKPN